jgi:hypothetical protein
MNARANGKVPKQGPPARLAAAWREHLAVRIAELETREKRLADPDFKKLAGDLLLRARGAIERRANPLAAWTGTDVERAWVSTHAAEVALVRGGSLDDVTGNLPSLLAGCGAIIPADSRVAALKKVVDAGSTVTPLDRTLAADTLQSAYKVSDAQHARVRSFRNLLLGATVLLGVFALLIVRVARRAPGAFAVCDSVAKSAATCPTGGTHSTGGDVFVVEVLGLFAAAITGAVAIRKLRGTSTPYAVPLASLILKLPIGALTALGGLMLVHAGFAPSITRLNQAQVSAYALVFGASQQLFMQFVDKQAQSVLNAVTVPPGDK